MTAVTTNEIAVNEAIEEVVASGIDVSSQIRSLASGKGSFFSSLRVDSFDGALAVVDAISNSEPVADNLNKVIHVKDIIAQPVAMTDRNTGEIRDVPRITLIAKDGKAYHAMSNGLFISIQNLIMVAGHPSQWPVAVPLIISREGKSGEQYFTARLAPRK